MDKVTIKSTKKGWTVHVPESQCLVFNWVLEEGLAGLDSVKYDDDQAEPINANGDLAKWNGIHWIWQ